MTRCSRCTWLAVLMLIASPALAQGEIVEEGRQGDTEGAKAPPEPEGFDWPRTRTVRSPRYENAHADRVILTPTAETHPEGTLFVSDYEILVIQVGYAWSDRIQTSLTVLSDFDQGGFGELNLKANVHRSRTLRIALTSGIDFSRVDSEDILFGRAGGTVQICFEPACRHSLSLSSMIILHDRADLILPVGVGAGFTMMLSDETSLLLEYSGLFNAAEEFVFFQLPIFFVSYGVRISANASWALDLGFLKEMATRSDPRERRLFRFLGVPLLAFTYRWEL